jgi:hypothetical protein
LELPRPRTLAIFFGLIPVVAIVIYWWSRPNEAPASVLPVPGENLGITVEVLNGTLVNGLARTVTGQLRRAGVDVVYFGSASVNDLDSTLILVRRGDSTVAIPIHRALAAGRIIVELDSLLLLDVTVLLGRDLASARGISP